MKSFDWSNPSNDISVGIESPAKANTGLKIVIQNLRVAKVGQFLIDKKTNFYHFTGLI